MRKISIILLFLLFACSDQIETSYKSFQIASKNSFFQKGWIPKNLVAESMQNIYLKNNIDTNSAIFYFYVSEMDRKKLENKLQISKKKDVQIRSLKIPSWWKKKIKNLPKYVFDDENNFQVHIAINKNTNEILGWRDDH